MVRAPTRRAPARKSAAERDDLPQAGEVNRVRGKTYASPIACTVARSLRVGALGGMYKVEIALTPACGSM